MIYGKQSRLKPEAGDELHFFSEHNDTSYLLSKPSHEGCFTGPVSVMGYVFIYCVKKVLVYFR